jgi:hypothetical protein
MQEEATRLTKRAQQLSQSSSKPGSNSSPSSNPLNGLDPSSLDPSGRSRIHDSPEPEQEGRFERRDSMIDVPIGLEGVWDLHGENPPPSSLAGRKDTVRLVFPHCCRPLRAFLADLFLLLLAVSTNTSLASTLSISGLRYVSSCPLAFRPDFPLPHADPRPRRPSSSSTDGRCLLFSQWERRRRPRRG